jgi:hypothetical protein
MLANLSCSDIMVYFVGNLDGQIKGHDDEAGKIAKCEWAFAVD